MRGNSQEALEPRGGASKGAAVPSRRQQAEPQAAYAVQAALVELRLEELRKALEAHEAVRPVTWARVGDLEHAEDSLADLIAFLRKAPRAGADESAKTPTP
ncbi:MAG TPA: hypothetical protein VF414_19930 [Thermoanaerobaculia bacterium]